MQYTAGRWDASVWGQAMLTLIFMDVGGGELEAGHQNLPRGRAGPAPERVRRGFRTRDKKGSQIRMAGRKYGGDKN